MEGREIVRLTENTVLNKTRVDNLKHVKNLNLWGNDLVDVSLLQQMPNVEVLSLSVNKINSLQDFGHCTKLQELYLRKNNIGDLQEVRFLKPLRHLKILWLCDNPCANASSYRPYVIWHLPQLQKLDNVDITDNERQSVRRLSEDDIANMAQRGDAPAPKPVVAAKDVMDNVRNKWQADHTPAQRAPAPARPPPPPAARTPPPAADMRSSASQKNLMTAVLALLNELSPDSLEIIHSEISDRLSMGA